MSTIDAPSDGQGPRRFAKDRDLGRLEAAMARLDAEAEAAVVRPSRVPMAAEPRAYLESPPEPWAKTSDAVRHAITEAVFERIDVLGRTTSGSRCRPIIWVTGRTFVLAGMAPARSGQKRRVPTSRLGALTSY
jgi:hypothetical protein